MRTFMIVLFSTITIHRPLVFGSELLSRATSFEASNIQASTSFSNQEEILKIIELSQKLTSPSHRSTFANKLTRQYLELKKTDAPSELIQLIRTTARELWLKDIHNESVITLKTIGKRLESLEYPQDTENVYELALQKALTAPIKQDLERLLAQLRASSDK